MATSPEVHQPKGLKPSPAGPFAGASQANAPRALYAQLLGASWPQLAEPVRLIHTPESTVRARGRFRIAHGRSHVARFLARLLRLPRARDAADTRLVVIACADGEQWRRTFDDRRLDSRQYQAGECDLAERIGLLELRFHLEASEGALVFRQLAAALTVGSVRLRLPAAWAPKVDAREDAAGPHQIRVHVRVELPVLGPVLTYDGIIDIEDARA
jgi:hypothetical protein